MSETDTDTQGCKTKISLEAMLSLVLSLAACVLLLCYLLLVRNRIIKFDNAILYNTCGLMPYLSTVALMLGILGLVRVRKSHGELKGYTYASLGIVLALFSFHLFTRCGETIRAESNIANKQKKQLVELKWEVEQKE